MYTIIGVENLVSAIEQRVVIWMSEQYLHMTRRF